MTELVDFFASDAIRPHISAFALGIIRLSVFISFAPFFGPNVTAAVKFPILLALYMPLHPFLVESPYILKYGTFFGLFRFVGYSGQRVSHRLYYGLCDWQYFLCGPGGWQYY